MHYVFLINRVTKIRENEKHFNLEEGRKIFEILCFVILLLVLADKKPEMENKKDNEAHNNFRKKVSKLLSFKVNFSKASLKY